MSGKKRILIVAKKIMYLILVAFVVLWGYCYAWAPFSIFEGISRHYVDYDFYILESYQTPVSHLSFSKWYYHEDVGKLKIENMNYKLVEDNVETIKDNIRILSNKLYELDNPINLEFNYDVVTSNDYYSLSSNVESVLLHYYDVDENILYIISFPI